MATENSFSIPRTSDGRIDAVFREMATNWEFTEGSADLGLGVKAKCGFRSAPSPEWKTALEADSHLARIVSTTYGALTVAFYRGGAGDKKSPFFDEVRASWNENQTGQPPTPQERMEIFIWLESQLTATDPARYPGVGLTPEQHQLEAIHNEILSRLEKTAARSLELVEEHRHSLDRRYDERVAEVHRELEEGKTKLEKIAAEREAALNQAQVALDARLLQVDASDNTFARRQIRDRMLDETRERVQNFGVTERTEHKRRPVAFAMQALIVVCGVAMVFTFGELLNRESASRSALMPKVSRADANLTSNGSSPSIANSRPIGAASAPPGSTMAPDGSPLQDVPVYWIWLRLTFATLATAAAIVYYARWQNAWAQRHADAEFQLQQFHLDVNRANWAIETCLEWKTETNGAPIPAELLASLTRNLFLDPRTQPEQVLHPADELASAILGTASHLKLKTDGAEIDINNPGKKLAGKKAVKAAETS